MIDNCFSLLIWCRRQLRIAMDGLVDWHWGIDTVSGSWTLSERAGAFKDANHNVPLSYYLLSRFLGGVGFRPDDVFYDIGCGEGRVLCYAARRRVSKVVGIELSRAFADKAEANARKLRGRVSPIEVHVGDAIEMDYAEGTIFFFYNPFGPATLQSVLLKIRQTLADHPRPIRFIYANPTCSAVFRSAGWLDLAARRQDFL